MLWLRVSQRNLGKSGILWFSLSRNVKYVYFLKKQFSKRMHSSRVQTVHCSGHLSCHAAPLPCTPLLPCMPLPPHMPPVCHSHPLHHTCPHSPHTPPSPYTPLCHAHHPFCHACPPSAHTPPFATHTPCPLWTDRCLKNITFPQLLLRTVKITSHST